jgi:uncharacterized protein (DUF2384 family)
MSVVERIIAKAMAKLEQERASLVTEKSRRNKEAWDALSPEERERRTKVARKNRVKARQKSYMDHKRKTKEKTV